MVSSARASSWCGFRRAAAFAQRGVFAQRKSRPFFHTAAHPVRLHLGDFGVVHPIQTESWDRWTNNNCRRCEPAARGWRHCGEKPRLACPACRGDICLPPCEIQSTGSGGRHCLPAGARGRCYCSPRHRCLHHCRCRRRPHPGPLPELRTPVPRRLVTFSNCPFPLLWNRRLD